MTLSAFLLALSQTPREWKLVARARIRCFSHNHGEDMCPLSALVSKSKDDWYEAALELGVSEQNATRIVQAADDVDNCNAELRARLLSACGLSEARP